jgi:hypothetical protein
MMRTLPLFTFALLLLQCKSSHETPNSLKSQLGDVEKIKGRTEYIASPYVTAGDRVYMVGHQDGSFPDLGWHITGEMGGIWDHPIKLMDGFTAAITSEGQSICLSKADTFYNYPFANEHLYQLPTLNLTVERMQFVPDGKEAVVVEYTLFNKSDKPKQITFDFNGVSDLRPTWLGEQTKMIDGKDVATYNETTQTWTMKDSLNEWYVSFGAAIPPTQHVKQLKNCTFQSAGNTQTGSLSYVIDIPAHASVVLPFTIAGSYQSSAQLKETYLDVQKNSAQYLKAKKEPNYHSRQKRPTSL